MLDVLLLGLGSELPAFVVERAHRVTAIPPKPGALPRTFCYDY